MAESAAPDQETQTIDQTPAEATGGPPQMPAWESAATLSDQPWLLSLWRPLLISLLSSPFGCWPFWPLCAGSCPNCPRLIPDFSWRSAWSSPSLAASRPPGWPSRPSVQAQRRYRTAELALILFITRVGIWAATGDWPGFELDLAPARHVAGRLFRSRGLRRTAGVDDGDRHDRRPARHGPAPRRPLHGAPTPTAGRTRRARSTPIGPPFCAVSPPAG